MKLMRADMGEFWPLADFARKLMWPAGGAAAVVSAALAIAKLRLPYVLHATANLKACMT
jgi:hypothetical protein